MQDVPCGIVTHACPQVFRASTMSAIKPCCSWLQLNRRGLFIHATLFASLVIVSVLSCVEMKEVGRGNRVSRTSLRRFCTGSGELFDVLQNGVFRSSLRFFSVVRLVVQLLQAPGTTFCRSKDRCNLTWPLLLKEEAAVVFRQ